MRKVLSLIALVSLGMDTVSAGPLARRRHQQSYSSSTRYSQDGYGNATFSHQEQFRAQIPPTGAPSVCLPQGDALHEVNEMRMRRGLRPFLPDPSLIAGAQAAAQFRAERLIAGHTPNDFGFLPQGAQARSAGCGAWEVGLNTSVGTWGTCCTFENYTYAGAGWAIGRDGKRYMHLFVR